MATETVQSPGATAKPDFRGRMREHQVNGCYELSECSFDGAIAVTRHLNALCLYMGAAVRERENFKTLLAGGSERPTDTLNNEIVGGAFDALAYLAGLANFFSCEAACNRGME